MYAIPLAGQQITITRLMRGEVVTGPELALCFACTSLAALLVFSLTARIYQSERLAIST
jgi:sodium transport system permease protein